MYTEIRFNWCATNDEGEEYQSHVVGKLGVKSITDCTEDKIPCFRVVFDDGKAELIFNPNRVFQVKNN